MTATDILLGKLNEAEARKREYVQNIPSAVLVELCGPHKDADPTASQLHKIAADNDADRVRRDRDHFEKTGVLAESPSPLMDVPAVQVRHVLGLGTPTADKG